MKHRFPFVPALLLLAAIAPAGASTLAISLRVDATDAPRNIMSVHETIPVNPGPLTLVYPEWIPGEHGPTGPVIDVARLSIMAGNTALAWRRDLVDMYAVHLEVPAGVSSIDVSFSLLLTPEKEGFSAGASSTPELAMVSWNEVILYPPSPKPDSILVAPRLKLPQGWKFGTALEIQQEDDAGIRFKDVSLSMLIDSPVLAGAHFRRIDVSPSSGVPHFIDMVSDGEATLDMTQKQIEGYRKLVTEANALFGAHHYRHYDFLYTLSDEVAHYGLEHHQCSDDRVAERTLIDENLRRSGVTLLSHEYVHSWNGKYRRPAGLTTGDFTTPMKDDLLWVYEGLTQYLGKLLAARSGLRSPEDYREDLAMLAANLDNRPGRAWRPLQDCADEAQLLYNARKDWEALRRSTDFYDEGDLIWLEVDVKIRELTSGKKSLNDFCRMFHGGESGTLKAVPYTFDDVVATLDKVAHFDWASLLTERLTSLNPRAPMEGVERSGWKLVYKETQGELEKAVEIAHKQSDLRYSLGLLLDADGSVIDIITGSPADRAGLAPGMKLVAVGGRKYTREILHAALQEGKSSTRPLALLCSNHDFYSTYQIDYHGGERFPALERDPSRPDLLSTMLKPIGR